MIGALRLAAMVVSGLFALSSIVLAHDCSGPDDCARVVNGSAIFAAVLALLLAAAPAVAKRAQNKKDKRPFKDCHDAVSFLKGSAQTAEADVRFAPTVSSPKVVKLADGSWQASADVAWRADPNTSTMTIPEWSWPNMSPADRAAVDAFTKAITGHEQGHFVVADKAAKDAGATVIGTGADADAASKDLQAKLNEYRTKTGEALDAATNDYDQVTDHGAKQSQGPSKGYPGGDDAVLTCP